MLVLAAWTLAWPWDSSGAGERLSTGDGFVANLAHYGSGAVVDGAAHPPFVKGWAGAGAQPFRLPDGSPIYSEAQSYCPALWLSGQAAGGRRQPWFAGRPTLVVEQGTLIGHSSRCLAAGLSLAKLARPKSDITYVAFDFFSSMGWARDLKRMDNLTSKTSALIRVAEEIGESHRLWHRAVWHEIMVDPVYAGARAVPGDIVKTTQATLSRFPPSTPVEIWSIDSAKSHGAFIAQGEHVWPRLRVGSVIHLLDALGHQLKMIFQQFVASGELECVFGSFHGVEWSFVVRRVPLDWQKVVRWHEQQRACEKSEACGAWHQAVHRTVDALARNFTVPPRLVKSLHQRIDKRWGGPAPPLNRRRSGARRSVA